MEVDSQYLKEIYLAQKIENGPASTGTIAERLDVAPATVNERIGILEKRGLVTHEKYKGVELTDEGLSEAMKALETYCTIEYFLVNVLEIENFQEESKQLQSVIDETVSNRLDIIVERNDKCPECFDPRENKCRYLKLKPKKDRK